MKSLQQQILQMEAAIAAGEERNHGNSNYGDAVNCHRTVSKTVQCPPVTPSGETGSRRHSRAKKVSSRDFAASPKSFQFHEMSLSDSAKKSSQLSGHISRHDDNVVVDLVDSDEGASSPDTRNGKLQRSRTGDRPDANDSQSSTEGDRSCHGNEEEVCGSDENEDIDHSTDDGRESDTNVEDGEMEGGREEEGKEDEDLGLDSDEDLFAPSEEAVCIPQTLSQEDPALKPRFIPPLLTSTPRPSLDPASLPPPSKQQTPEHRCSSVPHGGDDLNYLDDEDILPSLETNACVADNSSNDGGSPVKTVDATCEKHVNETGFVRNRDGLSPRYAVVTEQCVRTNNLGNHQNTTNQKHVTKLQTNKENVIRDDFNSGHFSGRERNSCFNKSKNLQQCNESVAEDARDSRQSASVSRNSDRNNCLREVSKISGDMLEDTEKDLPCQDNKTTKRSSPVTMTVVPPHGRHQKEAVNRGVEKEDAFPRRPDWVFIASGINKTTQQVGDV